ncbi:hypothetical protein IMX07_14735 [bacterium]|nr:hypothetical protein [bacterium]
MRENRLNPARNRIPKSATEKALVEGIENSGYPLQGVVAGKLLKRGFHVTEEWGFPSRVTHEPRTLDLLGTLAVHANSWTDVRPGLLLLIECKKSAHPYVFFRTLAEHDVSWFPRVAGLPHRGIMLVRVENGDVAGQHLISGAQSLGLDKTPFVKDNVDTAAVFSKAELKNDKAILSGSEPFNSIIMPLAQASDHAMTVFKHSLNSEFYYPRLIICIAVLDAPMVLVESPEQCADPVLTPWVRVIRQEPDLDQFARWPIKAYTADVVHVDFFDTFLDALALPFAEEFGKRAVRLGSGPMANGGQVPDMDRWEWTEICEFRR